MHIPRFSALTKFLKTERVNRNEKQYRFNGTAFRWKGNYGRLLCMLRRYRSGGAAGLPNLRSKDGDTREANLMESITLNVGQFVLAFVAAMGIPSAIMGIVVWMLERRISKQEEDVEDREDAREAMLFLVIRSSSAAIALGEATAKAVQRIPDAHCNGDMHAALAYAAKVKHEQKDFLSKQGVHALWD